MKKYGYAVYSSLLGGVLAVLPTRKEAEEWIREYYDGYGSAERLKVLDNYPL